MKSYAGIGSRDITDSEKELIGEIGKHLLNSGYFCYSGNADGSDITFQESAGKNCVVWLPWAGFNKKGYDVSKASYWYDKGKSQLGEKHLHLHPVYEKLTHGAKLMMRRNAHQVLGDADKGFPRVEFVICCSNYTHDRKGVWGGTGHAIRIAEKYNIPWFNIRGKCFTEFKEWYESNVVNGTSNV
jgi:hypothetical protein